LYAIKGTEKNLHQRLDQHYAEKIAKESGVLGLLAAHSGSRLHSLFGQGPAIGRDAVEALGGLIGNDFGDAYGINGLGVTGLKIGGGGLGEGTVGTDELGRIGRLGGKDGVGIPRVPWTSIKSDHRPRLPQPADKIDIKRGSLDKEIIRRVVRRHLNEIRYCYQVELQHQPELKGRVVVQFTIASTGQVVLSKINSSSLNNSGVEQCIVQAVRRWAFPKPKDGGMVVVSYPFVLHAAGG
jgi:TonB family protein